MNPLLGTAFLPISAFLVEGLRPDAVPPVAEAFESVRPPVVDSPTRPGLRFFETRSSFRPFLEVVRGDLDRSVFSPETRGIVALQIQSCLVGAVSGDAFADFLWQTQALDFFRGVPGAKVRRDPADRSLEFRFSAASFADRDSISLLQRMGMIESFLGGRIPLYRTEGGEVLLRIPPLSRIRELATEAVSGSLLFGLGGRARWLYVSGEMSRDDFNAAHLEDFEPIGLPVMLLHLSHTEGLVHPLLFAAHDLYHAVRVATLPAPLRRMAAGLYEAVRGLPPVLRSFPFIEPMLDVLSDVDLKNGSTDELLNAAFLPFQDEIRRARAEGRFDETAAAFHRRFLLAAHAGWEPYIHEARRDCVASYLNNLGNLLP